MSRTGAFWCDITSSALISFSGDDAVAFLHAQLTSDVASIGQSRTQYSGYCSPKGRLLATCLLWPQGSTVLMLLPASLRDAIQARLMKYVLRAKLEVRDATADYALFGIAGDSAPGLLAGLSVAPLVTLYAIAATEHFSAARLPVDRYLVLAEPAHAPVIRQALSGTEKRDESAWAALDVQAGIPVITPAAQDEYVPQMVNLDLVGGVSYTKGCYPGQEIVARTHYLGKLKQRMYRIRTADERLEVGDPLYSAAFGPEQASGAILYADHGTSGREALAVLQKSAVDAASIHLKSLDGPRLEILTLPYPVPA